MRKFENVSALVPFQVAVAIEGPVGDSVIGLDGYGVHIIDSRSRVVDPVENNDDAIMPANARARHGDQDPQVV